MPTELITVPADSTFEAAILALRSKVLREPLGMQYTPEQLAAESDQSRLVALVDGKPAACIFLARVNATTVKFRQMAVDPAHQGHGLGATLLHYAESVARNRFYENIELHARESALGFYQRAGYQTIGECFTEVTLPHWKMVKHL